MVKCPKCGLEKVNYMPQRHEIHTEGYDDFIYDEVWYHCKSCDHRWVRRYVVDASQ